MERAHRIPGSIGPGSLLTVVSFNDGSPMVWGATVRSTDPFFVNLHEDPALRPGAEVLVIVQTAGEITRTEAKMLSKRFVGSLWVLELEGGEWKTEERRRSPRSSCHYTARLRVPSVQGTANFDAAIAEFTDIGLGGGWIHTPALLPVGALVEWKIVFDGDAAAEGLALVARSSEELGGMALEFVEFFGNSRVLLEEVLQERAA